MAMDPAGEISELSSKLASVEAVLAPDTMRKEAEGLRERAGEPGLWEDQEQAQAVTRRLSYLDGELTRLDSLHRRLDDTKVLFELAQDAAVGRVRRARGADHDQRPGGRGRRGRLGRGPAPDLPALGGAARLLDRGLRHLLRGRG